MTGRITCRNVPEVQRRSIVLRRGLMPQHILRRTLEVQRYSGGRAGRKSRRVRIDAEVFKTSEGRDPRHGTKKGWDALSADASALSLGTGLWDFPYPKKESRISRIAALAVIPPRSSLYCLKRSARTWEIFADSTDTLPMQDSQAPYLVSPILPQ